MAEETRPTQGKEPGWWYKDAVIYEVPVRTFFDSNADGIGDFRGLIQKLPYLQELGVTALWLLPFYPSPLRDDGYDIADYYSINPIYGTLTDFRAFLRAAHSRGLKVITELVINHTSEQHPWFQRSRRAAAGSPARDFYVWSESPEKYKDARIIFRDFEPSNWTWDPMAKAYYWHRFYAHQPDLNFDNPQVHEEIQKILEFWLDLGVDGFRLDAIPYLFEREGTSCENLPETHTYLKGLRKKVDERYRDRMLLAEANQWPEDAVTYFGAEPGDECHMAFHFPLMPRLFMALRMEDRFPIVDILRQTPQIPQNCQWALFLRNHDELTLEMVTDEERDYMYRVYAADTNARINLGIRRRLAPLLNNDRKRIELLNILLLSFPGTPVLYYGDEIGMGDNIFLGDRNGVRTPMQWSADKNAGFSRASPQALYAPIILDPEYHYEAFNVETQQRNVHSLLWWTRRLLALRQRFKVFGRGSLEFLHPENHKILAFIRSYQNENILVVANLSRFPQPLTLDLSKFQGSVPTELFGQTQFPAITGNPYPLTLSPHGALWFSLNPAATETTTVASSKCPTLTIAESEEELFSKERKPEVENCLPDYMRAHSWFPAAGAIRAVRIIDIVPISSGLKGKLYLALVAMQYTQHDPDEYLLPLGFAWGDGVAQIEATMPDAIILRIAPGTNAQPGVLYESSVTREFANQLYALFARKRSAKGAVGSIEPVLVAKVPPARTLESLEPSFRTTARNTVISLGNKLVLKVSRRIGAGISPELEIGQYLLKHGFEFVPPIFGSLQYSAPEKPLASVTVLTGFIGDARSAWDFTLDALGRYFERVRAVPADAQPPAGEASLPLLERQVPAFFVGATDAYLEFVRLIGRRTAQMHMALASDTENKDFAPEPFTPFYQRSLYQSLRNNIMQRFAGLRARLKSLPVTSTPLAQRVLGAEEEILQRLRAIYRTPVSAVRIRCHGDYRLEQLLHTGKEIYITDFEGDPTRAISQRRIKKSALVDVASMLWSLNQAAHTALARQAESGQVKPEQLDAFRRWTDLWADYAGTIFVTEYLEVAKTTPVAPASKPAVSILLEAFVVDRMADEIEIALQKKPQDVAIPLQAIERMLQLPAAK